MRLLLDTCVLSELRKSKPNARVVDTIERLSSNDLYLSVVTIGEITQDIALMPASKKKRALQQWLQTIESNYAHRILGVNIETTRIWGEITAKAAKTGKTVPAIDSLIAATGIQHGLHILTRNVSDFEPTGAMVIDPWSV